MGFDYALINCQKQLNRNELPYILFDCFRDFPRDRENCDQVLFACLLMNKKKVRNYLLKAKSDFVIIENKN